MRLILFCLPLVAMAGCATPSQRIADELQAYGLPPANAECMGASLESNLSLGQLLELNRAVSRARQAEGQRQMGVGDLAQVAVNLDPAIQRSIARAGIECVLAR